MISPAVIPLRLHMARRNQLGLRAMGRVPFARSGVKSAGDLVEDAYLLVLLAEQAIRAGRDEQAYTLMDAAYAAFDRRFSVS
jgi:hypothetical protein